MGRMGIAPNEPEKKTEETETRCFRLTRIEARWFDEPLTKQLEDREQRL